MGDSPANAPRSTPVLKKARAQTMGKLRRMRPRTSKRDCFRASRTKCVTTSKIGPAPDPLRGSCRARSTPASLNWAGSELTTASMASAFASLRSVQTKIRSLRGGNDARRKAWKTQTLSFPPFPPRLEIRHKPQDFHIFTAPAAGSLPNLSRAPPHRIG
jgi:hypothetical protein